MSDTPKTCENCTHWNQWPAERRKHTGDFGDCRRHAPVIVGTSGEGYGPDWPCTGPGEACGDFKIHPDKAPLEKRQHHPFDGSCGWARLEIMGHRVEVGYVNVEEIAHRSMLRVDRADEGPIYYRPEALFGLEPITQDQATEYSSPTVTGDDWREDETDGPDPDEGNEDLPY
jgi:hypothetical protein